MSAIPSYLQERLRSVSMGAKLMMVCGLAVLMTIPAFFVDGLVDDRKHRAERVRSDVSDNMGGEQTFLGPTLVVPYSIPATYPSTLPERGTYLIFPVKADAFVQTKTEERHRSLFRVPVFQADLKLDADFDLTGVTEAIPREANLEWKHAELVVGASDARGALADATMTTDAGTVALSPAEQLESLTLGKGNNDPSLSLFARKAADLVSTPKFHVRSSLRFSGAQRIAVLAYGKSTQLIAEGDWPNPGFDGGVLPEIRKITEHGFTAVWSVPFIARNVPEQQTGTSIYGLSATAMGVSFVEIADPYQSVTRSLKYVLLFLGLVFLSYFVFEVTARVRVHPAQYILVGIAQIIFYLLLLAFAERVGFAVGFLIAGGATVGLLSLNAGWIFESRLQAVRAFVVFSVLYTLIYELLTLEDNALFAGAVASFFAVAGAMYLTRSIYWYRGSAAAEESL